MTEPLRWYDGNDDPSPWVKALAEVRLRATREGWCYQHVQAIIVAIDQYAEAATGKPAVLFESAPKHRRRPKTEYSLNARDYNPIQDRIGVGGVDHGFDIRALADDDLTGRGPIAVAKLIGPR